jgi:hypothetical protein
MSDNPSWLGWSEGDRVWHTGWRSVGTVRIVTYTPEEIAEEDLDTDHFGTVIWDNTCVTDELTEDMAEELEPYTGQGRVRLIDTGPIGYTAFDDRTLIWRPCRTWRTPDGPIAVVTEIGDDGPSVTNAAEKVYNLLREAHPGCRVIEHYLADSTGPERFDEIVPDPNAPAGIGSVGGITWRHIPADILFALLGDELASTRPAGPVVHGTWPAQPARTDFVVLHPDGRLTRHARDSEGLYATVSREIPNLGTQGMGRLRAWYDDNFAGAEPWFGGPARPPLEPNPLADRVLRGIGYMQPEGFWRGPVALSMEEGPDGDTAHMTADALDTIEDLAAEVRR